MYDTIMCILLNKNKLLKNFITLFIILSICVLQLDSVYSASDEVSPRVVKVQAASLAWTPTAPSWMDKKGFVWEIISNIFENISGAQKIKTVFVSAFQIIAGWNNNNIPKWDGSKFLVGLITDTGTRIWVNRSSPNYTLDVNGIINATSFRWNGANITSINGANITNGTISWGKIQDDSINTNHIINNKIIAEDIAAGSISRSELADNAVESKHIKNGEVRWEDLLNSWTFTMWNLNITGKISTTSPTNNNHVATKSYVDNHKLSCRRTNEVRGWPQNAVASCNNNEFLTWWGGRCEVPKDDWMDLSQPDSSLSKWEVGCTTNEWNNAASYAYAVCCSY